MSPLTPGTTGRGARLLLLGVAGMIAAAVTAVPVVVVIVAGVASGGGTLNAAAALALSACPGGGQAPAAQPGVSAQGKTAIPATYLYWYQAVGLQYGVPWTILAGIGTEESDNGQSTLPGVHSGANPLGAAGPMQIGIAGAAGNTWGGAPAHPAAEKVDGVATDEDGDGTASVYDPADAIAGAARYLNEHGFQQDPQAAVFAYNHATWYVSAVEGYAASYAAGGYTVSPAAGTPPAGGCAPAPAAPAAARTRR